MRSRCFVVLAAVAIATAVPLAAPQFWRAATMADFLKGDLERVSVDEQGRLSLGPAITAVFDTGAPFVWTAATAADGSTYLGTGNDGKVFKVDAAGKGTLFYDAPELEVHAVLPTSDGGLYVATSPDGRVYKVDRGGTARPFFDPEEKYIWALAQDDGGRLYVATGESKGRVYRVAANGTGEPFYTSTAAHVVSMAFDAGKRLVVGTEGPGRVFRLDADGKPFLLLDTNLQEVRALRVDGRGRIYAVAQARRTPGSDGGEATPAPEPVRLTPTPTVTTEITAMIVEAQATTAAPAAGGASTPSRGGAGAIFRIDADGTSDQVWEASDDAPYDVAFESDGAMLVATGHRGRLYRLVGDPIRATLVGRVDGKQAVQLITAGSRTFVATSNGGALARVDAGHADRGTYVSEVRDAKSVATWGVLSWRGITPASSRVEVSTRSGNSPTPDEAWSAWTAAYAAADGSPITSPPARYLQWRVTLSGADTPTLTSVSAAYLPRNQRPTVTGLIVHPPGVVFQKPFSTGETEVAGYAGEVAEKRLAAQGQPSTSTGTPTLGRRTYQKGLQTIVWKGDDANGDDLSYDVLARREGETTWRTLATELTDPIYVWDTTSVASGLYVIKIVASDAPSQGARAALKGDVESAVIDVDNVPPVLTARPVRRDGSAVVVQVDVKDDQSPLVRVEYSVDGGPWQAAFADDGLMDGRVEAVTLRLANAENARAVVVRAEDGLHNLGSTVVAVRP